MDAVSQHVVLFTTGGTIASGYDADNDDVRVNTPGDKLAEMVRPALGDSQIRVVNFSEIGSFALDLDTAFRLVKKIQTTLGQPDTCGVVVTHGTDTLEETAFLADLIVDSEKPVVFTGSQRANDEHNSDALSNLTAALKVAMSKQARGMGTLVVFDDTIHAARDVTKIHTMRVGAFRSGENGQLGEIDDGRPIFYRRPARRITFECESLEQKVDLIKLALGADARFIDCALDSGAQALVLEAFGRGNATPAVLEGVKRASARNVPVVITSRCPEGRVAPIYGHSGGASLRRANSIFAGNLSAIKARILLAVLLGKPGLKEPLDEAIAAISL
ncbi:MAG: asparaginase [Hyphomicrobiales bacterium]